MNKKSVTGAIVIILAWLWSGPNPVSAQVKVHHKNPGPVSFLNPWSTNNISICATGSPRDFQAYRYIPGVVQGYFIFHWSLWRDQQQVANYDAIWDLRGNSFVQNYTFQYTFFNVVPEPGTYQIHLLVTRRTGIFPFFSYQTAFAEYSNAVAASMAAPTASFKIRNAAGNWAPPNPNGSPIPVSLSKGIIMDASASTCEPNYMISIQESDLYWNRTYLHEMDRWFNGQAPSNLDLQQLVATYSTVSGTGFFTLLGGNFTAPPAFQGQPRYYRVGLQAGSPWNPVYTLIRVDW